MKKKKKAQEEMVGFALIIILVAVILLVFLSFYLRKSQKEEVKSYEVNSFIQSVLQYTTSCEKNSEYLSIQKLISECEKENECEDGVESCYVLKNTLKGIVEESWKVGEDEPVKGYKLEIFFYEEEVPLVISKGETGENFNNKKDSQLLPKGEKIFFTAYY